MNTRDRCKESHGLLSLVDLSGSFLLVPVFGGVPLQSRGSDGDLRKQDEPQSPQNTVIRIIGTPKQYSCFGKSPYVQGDYAQMLGPPNPVIVVW